MMEFKIVDYDEFKTNEEFFTELICTAQNTKPEYKTDVLDYYKTCLKENAKNFVVLGFVQDEKSGQNQIAGCVFFRYYDEENRFFMLNVNTKKEFQNSKFKVATNVVSFGLEHFFKTCELISLWVEPDNKPALKLYENLNFKEMPYEPKGDFLKSKAKEHFVLTLHKKDFVSKHKKD